MKMKKLLLVLFVLPILIYSQSGPKLEVDGGDAINTGTHLRGKEVNYDISFKNTGDQDLKITAVQTSCGCSSALASNDVIKPGESGTIKFTFNGLGFGTVTKAVTISTNEAAGNVHTLQVTMTMADPVTLNPQSIISEGKVGDELKQTATVLNSLENDISISEITSNSPVIKITSDKMKLTAGETATLNISIKIYEESAINAAIIVKTSVGEFQIPVLIDVKPN